MSTPQKKVWSGWLSPTSEKNGFGSDSLDHNSSVRQKGIATNGGMMNQQVLIDEISKLEKELYEYQYNMGLLLIEKKEWTSKNEQFQQALSETKELLQREQTSHMIAISEVEKREEKLRNALGVEKQCVHQLEKALHEMRLENAEIKVTAESKLEAANALSSSVEEKSLQAGVKLRAADAKLADVSRKTSEIQRKSVEFEAKEKSLQRERFSLNAEREAHEHNLSHQREDLREWERKLQEGEERLAEVRRLLNQREERANENDRIFKQKQAELEETQKRIDLALSSLKTKEDDMNSRIGNLTLKEEEADAMSNYLNTKEKELLELEEKLKVREQVEIQKLLDEEKIILDAKKHDFELGMEQKKKSLDNSFKSKVVEVEKKEAEVYHLEGIIAKREQALEKKLEQFKEKEEEFDSKSKALKEREKSLKVEEKNLEVERKQVCCEKENLLGLEAELQKSRTDIEEQRLKVIKDQERLLVTEKERSEHIRLQSELKQEIERSKLEREALLKERDDLKQEREKFEKEWEDLDEKRAEIQRELKSLAEQKEKVEKLNCLQEERLNNQRSEMRGYVERELEELKLAKDTFAAAMEHEKSVLAEKYQSERSKMLHEFEAQKQELETALQKREVEIETQLHEKEKAFEEERDREQTNITYLRDVARRDMEEVKLERLKLEKEKLEIFANQKHLEAQQLEMKKDIDDLLGLSMKLKDQREQFLKERERFVAFVEKQKGCEECGARISEFMLPDLQSLEVNTFALPRIADGYLKEAVQGTSERPNGETSLGVANSESPASGAAVSWLRKCTSKIFIFSARKRDESESAKISTGSAQAQEKLVDVGEIPEFTLSSEDEPEGSARVPIDSADAQRTRSETSAREVEAGLDPSANDLSNSNSQAHDVEEASRQPNMNEDLSKPPRRGRTRANNGSVHANGALEDSVYTHEENQGELALVGNGTSKMERKRKRTHTSEPNPDDSENSGSVTTEGRRNRRRKAAPVVEQKRYNLWRPKIASPIASGRATSNPSGKDGVDGVRVNKRGPDSNVQSGHSTSFTNFNHAGDSQADQFLKIKAVEDTVSRDEINGTPQQDREGSNDQEIGTPAGQEEAEDSEDEDEDEDGVERPAEVSIGRKLWTFIST